MKKISTSKLILGLLIFNFVALQLFTCAVVYKMLSIAAVTGIIDFTPLVTLISTVIGEVLVFMTYVFKSAKENSAGGLVYEKAMAEINSVGGDDNGGISNDED